MADSKKTPYGTITNKAPAIPARTVPGETTAPDRTVHSRERLKGATTPTKPLHPARPEDAVSIGDAPHLKWGLAIWDTSLQGVPTGKHPAFLDGKGQWWWATTANQQGVNPAVEQVARPIEWEPLK